MRIQNFDENAPGSFVGTIHGADAFLPDPLPPEIDQGRLVEEVYEAATALGQLRGLGPVAGDPSILRSPFIRKEAEQSSQIEGTRVTLSDLYAYEAGHENIVEDEKRRELPEVFNHVQTIEFALSQQGNGITIDFICELNRRLLSGVRGEERDPGQLRETQNWIGETNDIHEARYVPPPSQHVRPLLERLVEYINGERQRLPLIDIALMHYQFEAIHPFRDGNGRVGRLLITLQLLNEDIMPEPYLYLSAYLNENRDEYTDHLLAVSQENAWHEWVEFLLNGITEQANEAQERAGEIVDLRERYRQKFQSERSRVLEVSLGMFNNPYFTIKQIASHLELSYQQAYRAVNQLEHEDVVTEVTDRQRNKIFCAHEVLNILGEAPILNIRP